MVVFMFISCGKVGEDGKDGAVNVFSKVVTINPSDWSSYTYTTSIKTAEIIIPEITSQVVAKGAVLVFNKLGRNDWQPLPYTMVGDGGQLLRFFFSEGKVRIQIYSEESNVAPIGNKYQYKIVVLDGDAYKASELKSIASINEFYNTDI